MYSILFSSILLIAIMPFYLMLVKRLKWLDYPGDNSVHNTPKPTTGGLLLLLVFMTIINICYFFLGTSGISLFSFIMLQLSVVAVSVIGLIDDIRSLKAIPKLLTVIIAAVIFGTTVADVRLVTVPFLGQLTFGPPLSVILAVAWIVLVSSAINILDGLDGLLTSYTFIFFVTLALISLFSGVTEALPFSQIMVGLSLGFYFFNSPPARIYLGNVGSQFIGFIIAVTPLMNYWKASATISTAPLIIIISYPIIDLVVQFTRRLFSGKNPFRGDLYHFHHICYFMNLGHPRYLIWLNWIFVLNACLALFSICLDHSWRFFLMACALLINLVIFIVGTLLFENNIDLKGQRSREIDSRI